MPSKMEGAAPCSMKFRLPLVRTAHVHATSARSTSASSSCCNLVTCSDEFSTNGPFKRGTLLVDVLLHPRDDACQILPQDDSNGAVFSEAQIFAILKEGEAG